MDIYPNIAVRTGALSDALPAKLWGALSATSLRHADRVITLSAGMKDSIVQKGVHHETVSVVPPWGDAADAPCTARNPFRDEHIPPGKISVMYSGNLGACHLWKEMAEAVRKLEEDERLQFLFIGGGKGMPLIREAIGNCRNVKFLPYQDREMLPFSLAAGDIHLTSLDPRVDGLLLPSKLFGIMAAGRPIIHVGSLNADPGTILRENGCGIVSEPGNGVALVAAIRKLADDPELRARLGDAGREAMLRKYDKQILIAKMVDILESEGEAHEAARAAAGRFGFLGFPVRLVLAVALICWAVLTFRDHLAVEAWRGRITAPRLDTAVLREVEQIPARESLLRSLSAAATERVFPRRWDAASAAADRWMDARPFAAASWVVLARSAFMNGKPAQADAALEYAAKLSPGFPGNRLQALPIYVMAGEREKAESLAREVAILDSAAPFEVVPQLEASGFPPAKVWELSSAGGVTSDSAVRLLRAISRSSSESQEQIYSLIPEDLRNDPVFRDAAVRIFSRPLAPSALEDLWRRQHGDDIAQISLADGARLLLQSPENPGMPREAFHFGWQRPSESIARSVSAKEGGTSVWRIAFRRESRTPSWTIHRGLILGPAKDLIAELRLNCVHSSDDRFRLVVSGPGGEKRGEWVPASTPGRFALTVSIPDSLHPGILEISVERHNQKGLRSSAEIDIVGLFLTPAANGGSVNAAD